MAASVIKVTEQRNHLKPFKLKEFHQMHNEKLTDCQGHQVRAPYTWINNDDLHDNDIKDTTKSKKSVTDIQPNGTKTLKT